MKLIFALDLVRHGHRTPVHHLPEISNIWTKGQLGHLLDVGREQAELFGTKMRQYYVTKRKLLPAKLDTHLMQVRSTDMQRTKETARALLRGLYPGQSDQIRVHFVPQHEDTLLLKGNRPHLQEEILKIKQAIDKHFQTAQDKFHKQARKELAIVNEIFGTHFNSAQALVMLSDLLYVSKIHDKPLIKTLGKDNADAIIELGEEAIRRLFNNNLRVSCIYAHDFILHLADQLEERSLGKTSSPPYILYAGHDINIWAICCLLGTPVKKHTPYLSNVRFELFKDAKTSATFVRASLNGKALKVCRSGTTCPTAEFVKTIRESVESKCPI